MNHFEKNLISIYGHNGKTWLIHLPRKLKEIAEKWELTHLKPFTNLSHNYVLEGFQKEKPIVLKLGLDEESLEREADALTAFKGYGAVSLLERKKGALLLQRALPGKPLKNPNGIKIACEIAKKLHEAPLPTRPFPHIRDWLSALDQDWNIPAPTLQKARLIKNDLLKIPFPKDVLLHGDLHRENILSNGKEWLVIDPKGVIGSPIHEVWAFVEEPATDLAFISDYFDFKLEYTVQWYYVHLVLAACWRVEDNLDPKLFLDLAHKLSL